MRIKHLSFAGFRNYRHLGLDLGPGIFLFHGDNAQGKTNLLEGIYVLAATRSPRAATDAELVNWASLSDDIPVCRLAASVEDDSGSHTIEMALTTRASSQSPPTPEETLLPRRAPPVHKRLRVDGVPRRAVDVVGRLKAVVFTVQDIDIISGEPAIRRRYLDIVISQLDRQYLRLLQRYAKVLWQRNRLLHRIADNEASPEELAFWDQELMQAGAYLVAQRTKAIASLESLAQPILSDLTGSPVALKLTYIQNLTRSQVPEPGSVEQWTERFREALDSRRSAELGQRATLVGPHRDELRFVADGVDVGRYSSRGQQRTLALALKLAQARFVADYTRECPVLLLDDVLSELDARRRAHVLTSIQQYDQVMLTATELDQFDPAFLSISTPLRIAEGRVLRSAA